MTGDKLPMGQLATLSLDGLRALIAALGGLGYQVLGPTLRDGAILYDDVAKLADLPSGWTDHQEAGRYRLERRADDALFGYAVGPQSWRRFLHPPIERMWRAHRTEDGFTIAANEDKAPKFAFLGVRACEIHAIVIQDKVLVEGPYVDAGYQRRRRDNFLVAVNCGQAGGTCFCVSMNTGPKADAGFDLALTELVDDGDHRFLVEVGSPAGGEVLSGLPRRDASNADVAAAEAVMTRTAGSMGRALDTRGLKELLQSNPTHPRWDDVAARCLSCANCTDGVPHLLLHHGRRPFRPDRGNRRTRAPLGFLFHGRFFLHSRWQRAAGDEVALPSVDHPQARELDRSVRYLGMRRVRALRDLVSGRHRHHHRGGGDPCVGRIQKTKSNGTEPGTEHGQGG